MALFNDCGHPNRPRVARRKCKSCYRKWWNATRPGRECRTNRIWRKAHPGYHAARTKKWRERNPEKAKALVVTWCAANVEYRAIYLKAWRDRHPGYARAQNAAWAAKNLDKKLANNAKRRALKLAATLEHFTEDELRQHVEVLGGVCVYCGDPYDHLDHVYPLARGGAHALYNLVPACAACNMQTHDSLPLRWLLRKKAA